MEFVIFSFWIICGIIGSGFINAYFRARFPEQHGRSDIGEFIVIGLFTGPIFMIFSFFVSGFAEYGWNLKGKVKPNESFK